MYISLLGSFEINLMNQQEWPISTNNNLILIQGSYDRMMLQRSHKLQTLCISFFGFPKCFKFLEVQATADKDKIVLWHSKYIKA